MRNLLLSLPVFALTAFALNGCASHSPPSGAASLIDPTLVDSTVSPCDDFFQYACGNWLAHAQIPEDRPAWSRGFDTIDENNELLLRGILEGYVAGQTEPVNPYHQKLGDFYAACMNEPAIESGSLAALHQVLEPIDQLADKQHLPALLAELHLQAIPAFFDFSSQPDFKNPEEVIGAIDQGGLGLPDRDYYLSADPKMKEIRGKYRKHVTKVFELFGRPRAQAAKLAAVVVRLETKLARASMSRVDRRDPKKTYHRLERAGLEKLAPGFDWGTYFQALGYGGVQAINVVALDYFPAFDHLVATTPLKDLKTYFTWRGLDHLNAALDHRFVDENFRFSKEALTGQKALPVRWKRCVRQADRLLAFALGRSFVEKTYGAEGKAASKAMISHVEASFGEGLKTVDWMDAPTRAEAARKLSKIFNKVGYPDHWRNYDALTVDRSSYLKNLVAAREFLTVYDLNKIGKPLDRGEWDMGPAVVNAYYDPSLNEMVFPAGILQSPFFNRAAPVAQNYGGIGMVMGHELTHGFDDEGRQFDGDGKLRDWWTPAASHAFDEKAACLVQQYGNYTAVDDLHLNGKLTLGENIADQGGIHIAYRALQMETGGTSVAESRDFFLAFAQSWCTKRQDKYQRMLVTVDPHSPPRYRVNGVVANFPEFARAFGCHAGQPMAPVNSCKIW